MGVLDQETLNTREFDKLAEEIGMVEARAFASQETPDLEKAYSAYHVEKKCRMEALKEIPQYKEDLDDIKAVKSSERDRIAPEKALFDLAILVIEVDNRNGSESEIRESKQFEKAAKISGDKYIREFYKKSVPDLKEYCVRFYLLKRQVEMELKMNTAYQAALERKKAAEEDVKIDLYGLEVRAKVAMTELKNRKDFEEG